MKKILAILLAAMLLLSLAACGMGGGNEDQGNEDGGALNRTDDGGTLGRTDGNSGNIGGIPGMSGDGGMTPGMSGDIGASMDALLGGAAGTIYGQMDEASKQMMIAEATKEGLELSFGPDGSMTVKDPDGTIVKQNPDGSWDVVNEDGSVGQLGGNWPDNEFTRLLPKPDMTVMAVVTEEEDCNVLFSNATIEQIKAYAEQVKAKGFTIDVELEDQEIMGMVIYTYSAKNAQGYEVMVSYASGTSSVGIRKPD